MTSVQRTPARRRPRSPAQIGDAVQLLTARTATPAGQTPYHRGALDAYLWVLGQRHRPPLTGAPVTGRYAPDHAALEHEQEAADLQLAHPYLCTRVQDYARGVRDALTWATARSDARP
jgi:hypothetical protein